MKLRFLGQTYSTSNHPVETIPSDMTAHFLGQSYTLRRLIQAYKSQSQLGIKNSYTNSIECFSIISFLRNYST